MACNVRGAIIIEPRAEDNDAAANPIGIDVDFEALNARRKSGESAASLTDYATAGK